MKHKKNTHENKQHNEQKQIHALSTSYSNCRKWKAKEKALKEVEVGNGVDETQADKDKNCSMISCRKYSSKRD